MNEGIEKDETGKKNDVGSEKVTTENKKEGQLLSAWLL